MQALIIQQVATEDIGNLKPILNKYGFKLNYIRLWADNFNDFDPQQPDLLIILGGPLGVYNMDIYPKLKEEINFVKKRLTNLELPTLGICLGAQIIAYTLGSKVYPGPVKELGFGEISLIDQSKNIFFNTLTNNQLKVLHWHGDTFDLPPGTNLLGSSKHYPHQAFCSNNQKILGLQFHLEVLADDFEEWLITNIDELTKEQINIPQMRSEALIYLQELHPYAVKFWSDWLNNTFSN